jgi:hypothetical protein
MNKFLAINDSIGYVFGGILLAGGMYFGVMKFLDYRKELHKQAQAWVDKELTDPKYSLPAFSEYPEDGPLADFYRNQGNFKSVAPITIEPFTQGYPAGVTSQRKK